MIKMVFVCKYCGQVQVIEIWDPEEAKQKKVRLVPPKCERCGSYDIVVRD
jgi:hypothetical protein